MRSDRLEPGRRLSGRYVLEQPLGTGASGAVWSARDEEGGRRVALKLLHAHLLEDGGSRDPLAREHEALLQLDHPHLAQCFGLEQDGDQIFLVLELIEGEMLHVAMGARASTGARFAPHEIERWSDELASALEHAHARGVVHRDLKPQNIALERTPSGLQARLLDFGIARLLENSVFDRTTWGRKLGSVFYMSPEQIEGAPAAPTSDVFSLSSVLFELVTLRRCWVAGHPAAFAAALPRDGANVAYAVFERICHGPRPRPSEVDPMTPPSVDAVLARGLAVDPGDRYAGPHELHAALLEALAPDATRIDLAPAFGASADPDATVAFVEGVKASNIPETMAYVAASAGRSPEAASPKAGGPEPESTQMIGAADLPPTRALPRSEVEGTLQVSAEPASARERLPSPGMMGLAVAGAVLSLLALSAVFWASAPSPVDLLRQRIAEFESDPSRPGALEALREALVAVEPACGALLRPKDLEWCAEAALERIGR